MTVVMLSPEFQISIPKDIFDQQNWGVGQQFVLIPDGKRGVKLVPVPTLEDLRGIAEGADTSSYRDRNDRY